MELKLFEKLCVSPVSSSSKTNENKNNQFLTIDRSELHDPSCQDITFPSHILEKSNPLLSTTQLHKV